MSPGKANHKLRQAVLFAQTVKLGEHSCFKCGELIETVEDFSIEHKEPWLHGNVELFWDLGNIAFSHRKCNRPRAEYVGVLRRTKCPEGYLWCPDCKSFKPRDAFNNNRTKVTRGGKEQICRVCKAAKSAMRRMRK